EAVMALAVSGTVTLELALAQLPMVVIYVMDAPQARVYRQIGSPAVSLPNIVLARPAVPELVMAAPDIAAIIGATSTLLDDKAAREAQIAAVGELAELMENGEAQFPRQDPADRVLAYWPGS